MRVHRGITQVQKVIFLMQEEDNNKVAETGTRLVVKIKIIANIHNSSGSNVIGSRVYSNIL